MIFTSFITISTWKYIVCAGSFDARRNIGDFVVLNVKLMIYQMFFQCVPLILQRDARI